jgi:hypothetical protein
MTGIGIDANVHSWKNGELRSAIDKYTALGPLTWRVIIERADWEPVQQGTADEIDDDYYGRIYSAGKMKDLWDTIEYIESAPGQIVSLSIMGGVSEWIGGNHIDADKEDYWVRMIASLLDYGRRKRHVSVSLVSPFNEPDWDGNEGPKVEPEQMARLLEKLSRRLDSLGMSDTRFVVPDTASAAAARSAYLPVLLANPVVAAKIARIGIHSYTGESAGVAEYMQGSAFARISVWATEFNAWCDGCDAGRQPPDSWGQAQSMAHNLLSLISQGIGGAQLYDAWDGYYEHHGAIGYWGALAYDQVKGTYAPRRLFDVLSLAATNIAQGAVLIGSSGAAALADKAAFLIPQTGEVTIVGSNSSSSPQRFRLTVSGSSQVSHARLSIVEPGTAGVRTIETPVQDDALVVPVPAGAVFAVSALR